MSPRSLPGLLPIIVAMLAASAPARADVFGPISLVSASAIPGYAYDQQADGAADAAISGDGRYVAFDGSFAGRPGVFRRDLSTGEVLMVAEGDAQLPSISADGRYVSFTTTARLDARNDTNAAPDVYVRDMARADTQPCPQGWEESSQGGEQCAFTLVSAVSGSARGLSYRYGESPAAEEPRFGSVASGRSALSADGSRVAFETTASSNLANPERTGSGEELEAPATPATQVAVRDLQSRVTTLVSASYDPASGGPKLNGAGLVEPTPNGGEGGFGAVYPSGEASVPFPAAAGGASISADGSTVAWMGQQISEQAPVMSGQDLATNPRYTEPLWRRIGDGPLAPTRRVTGGSDPTAPLCMVSGEGALSEPPTLSDPCQGPFDVAGGQGAGGTGVWTAGTLVSGGVPLDYLPRMSGDGMTVAFISNAREIASGEEFKAAESSDDLYVVDMRDGLTRVLAARRLTELASGSAANEAATAPIVDLGVSPDGSQVAFSTKRTEFPLGSPAYVTPPSAQLAAVELFEVDLADDTLTRVTQGYEGQPSEATPGQPSFSGSPSFSSDGYQLAFSSNSDNLTYGDGNRASDAFLVTRQRLLSTPTPQEISPPPANPVPSVPWKLQVTARSRRDGSVQLEVIVPAAGSLSAAARGRVRLHRSGARRAAARRVHARGSRRRPGTPLATRTVASTLAHPRGAGLLRVILPLNRRYGSLASARGGLAATVGVAFSAPGHPLIRQRISVTFVRRAARARRGAGAKGGR